ncbi:MAG: oligosaccharide flippase family protein [Dermatophilaceae bacterium]
MTDAEEPQGPPGRLARLMSLARLGHGGSGRHVANLTAGTAIAQVLMLAAQWACGKYYDDTDFGVFGNLIAFATIVSMVATLRLEMAIPLAAEDDEADDLARFTLVCASVVSALLVAVSLLVTVGVRAVPSEYRLTVQIAPFIVWASAGFAVLRVYQSRRGQFRQMSDANVAGTAATGVAQVGLGAARMTQTGLGLGYGLGRLVSTVMMIRRSGMPVRGSVRGSLVRRWSQFPTWVLLPAVLNAATVGAVTPYVTALYGVSFAGQFSFTQRLLTAPAALLGQAVASVFYVRFAELHRQEQDAAPAMVRLARVLLAIAMVVFVPVTLLGREAFVWIWSGPKWETAGLISGVLAPWLMMSFVSSPLSGYATVKNEVRRLFALAWLEAGVRVPALALGVWVGGPLLGVQAYSFAGLVICLYWTVWVIRLSGASTRTAWGVVTVPLVVVLAAWGFSQVGRDALGEGPYVVASLAACVVVVALSARGVLRALRA